MFPLTCLTHGSILNSPTKPSDMRTFLENHKEFLTLPITDIGNTSQAVKYMEEIEQIDRKPVIGMQLKCENSHIILYCKNKKGWKNLIKLESESSRFNQDEPQLSIDKLRELDTSSLICVPYPAFKNIKQLKAAFKNIYTGLDIQPNWALNEENLTQLQALLKSQKKAARNITSSYIVSNNKRIRETEKIYEEIEEFSLLEEPALPNFQIPDDHNQDSFLQLLCERGMKDKELDEEKYRKRLELELAIIQDAGMAGYFLILQDITNFCLKHKQPLGVGRGSAAGCLISYLTNITQVDPLKYNLLFERFYSADRKGMPDIDIDIPPDFRPQIEQYIENKYGKDKFGQLATFGTFKGKAALKLALSQSGVSFVEQNLITDCLPEAAKVDPQLQEQKEKYGTKSLVLYALRTRKKKLEEWCTYKRGKYEGEYAKEFKLAVELDGIISDRGKHASAFVLSDKPIIESAPVVWDNKDNKWIVGLEMNTAEHVGLVKMDLLGVDILSKYNYVREVMKSGNIVRKTGDWQ